MQVVLNEKGYVKAYALMGSFSSGAIEVDEPVDINDFEENYGSYYLSKVNVLVKDDNKQTELEDNRLLTSLRSQRQKICFPYINRGELWYSRLSVDQMEELKAWYHAWLDVTETKTIPSMPTWLSAL
jgi:hypothetical protein